MMNSQKTLDGMLWIIIPNISKIIAEKKNITMKEANKIIYNSKLYKTLENAETKMWYYSDEYLADFFLDEYEKKEL